MFPSYRFADVVIATAGSVSERLRSDRLVCDAPRNAQGLPLDYIRNGYTLARMGKSEPQVPLTPAVFHILLALVGQERHGYDIMQQVTLDSQAAVKMGPGLLYGPLARMIDARLVDHARTTDQRI